MHSCLNSSPHWPGSKVRSLLTILKAGLILLLVFTGFAFGEGSFEHFTVQLEVAPGRGDGRCDLYRGTGCQSSIALGVILVGIPVYYLMRLSGSWPRW